ncbi:SDR family NAD(P)-dependent oxidoreductase [Paenibacillus pectinilyticus]|uniref:SDR family NAD(P)-dependent oxidoreductase n=1 Tax=Paenibacillus pectinilyticus TaxID=512399 RepID=UPI001ABF3A5E|nr:SDR family NAD(P)-dependent oxidoreductase [Paenibacillus pectinilyticus]
MENVAHKSKVAVISGGTSGVGKKTALDLAKKNIITIILGRDKEKGIRAKNQIINESGNDHVEFYPVDLCSLDDIKKFRSDFETKYDHIDILVSAAGVMYSDLKVTKEGYDQNFVINYLAHFWLINEMLPLLKNAEQGRILLVGAIPFVINHSKVELPKLEKSTKYSGFRVVGESLMLRVLLTVALSEQLKNTSITANVFHPGYVTDSNYGADLSGIAKLIGSIAGTLFSKKNAPIGRELALDPTLSTISGRLFNEKKEIVPLSSNYKKELADELWRFSLTMYK